MKKQVKKVEKKNDEKKSTKKKANADFKQGYAVAKAQDKKNKYK